MRLGLAFVIAMVVLTFIRLTKMPISREIDTRLREINESLLLLGNKLDGILAQVELVEATLGGLEAKVDEIDGQLPD
jgi:cob(I)alamin adenosyltransferase